MKFIIIQQKIMQSSSLDKLNLYYEKNCKDKCYGNKVEGHKGTHSYLSYANLIEVINMYIFDDTPELKIYIKQINQILTSIRDMAESALKQLKSQINKHKIKTILNIKTQDSLNACQLLASGKVDQIQKVRCCDLYDIFYKINYSDPSPLTFNNNSALQISQKITHKISQEINKYNELLAKYSPKSINGKISKKDQTIKKQQQDQFCVSYESDSQKQARPVRRTRNQSDRRQQRIIQKEKKEDNKQIKQKLKIRQLEDVGNNQRFEIRLKIIRIVKRFKIGDTPKVQFIGGDDTGIATCVMTQNRSAIVVNNTIDITDCRIYNFKGRIKQIQSSEQSIFYLAPNIKQINYQFNLTEKRDQRNHQRNQQPRNDRKPIREQQGGNIQNKRNYSQDLSSQKQNENDQGNRDENQIVMEKKESKKMNKISEIEPDSQSLNIIAQVYKLLGEQDDIIDCYIGDQTGIVRAHLPRSRNFIKQGCAVKITSIQSNVVEEHIIMKLTIGSKIEPISITFPIIKFSNDISAEEWAEVESSSEGDSKNN